MTQHDDGWVPDPTEAIRQRLTAEINSNPKTREELEAAFGAAEVWDTVQLKECFESFSFLAPFCIATRKKDGVQGVLMFQHHPRFYFAFKEV